MTPGNLGVSTTKAGEQVRAKDSELLRTAYTTSTTLIGQLRLAIQQVEAAAVQKQHPILAAVGGLILGILLWSILPGIVVRTLPASWGAPEWMATRTMRMDRAQAGARLLGVGSAVPASGPVVSATLTRDAPKPHHRKRR